MTAVFADTSYYLALFNENDVCHEAAARFSRDHARHVVLTDLIVVELGNTFCRGAARRRFVELVEDLRRDPSCEIAALSSELLGAGLRLFRQRPDKEWSLTDCVSFVVMKQRRLAEALTSDRHFEQAGFKVLLK